MNRARVITRASGEWVEGLTELGSLDPPKQLHAVGMTIEPDDKRIAVVGTRRPTAAGIEATQEITRVLVEAGYCIVSGLALGIDAAAHRAALENGGKTIAVLGCGVDVVFPRRNAKLRDRIAGVGTLISEYELGYPPLRHNFPARNRIIVGFSSAVVVIEGGLRSGALITARQAIDANRLVFALPGSIRNAMAAGPNELIRTCQATPITSAVHIFEELAPNEAWAPAAALPGPKVGEDEATILGVLDDVPVSADFIARQLHRPPGSVLMMLSRLEVRGLARKRPGGYEITMTGARARGAGL
jgi:DNA processing protein